MTRRRDSNVCRHCGSRSLFSGYFDKDGYAVPLAVGDSPEYISQMETEDGVKWTTYCQDCGEEQR